MTIETKITIDSKKCKGCELCIPICPKEILKMSKQHNKYGNLYAQPINQEYCTRCGNCYQICPDLAIEIQ